MTSLKLLVTLALVGALTSCEKTTPAPAPTPTPSAQPMRPLPAPSAQLSAERVQAGKARVQHFQCNRCHDIQGVEPVPIKQDCVGCHQEILAGSPEIPGFDNLTSDTIAKWQRNIVHLTAVPELEAMAPRFKRSWLVDFLQDPHDLRPNMPAQMPRLNVTAQDAEQLADFLMPQEYAPQPLLEGDALRGQKLANSMGCGSCHAMTGGPLQASAIPVELAPQALALGMKLAPDLRHTRKRFHAQALVSWLQNPAKLKPSTPMPTIPMSEQDARDIAAFLITARLDSPPKVSVPQRLPVLEREVTYEEVSQKVFKKICWHCHSNAAMAEGDGGPGNTGGFGFEGRKLSLASYGELHRGMRDESRRRINVFQDAPDGSPWLVSVMMARYAEVAGGKVEGVRGMPLGLPPMSLEEVQLVESWIAQGRPR